MANEIKYLEENGEEKKTPGKNNSTNADITMKSTNFSKGFIVKSNQVPKISCFELAIMITGNYINNLIDYAQTAFNSFDQLAYKFISYVFFEESCQIISNFFSNTEKESFFIPLDPGKFIIEIHLKQGEKLEIYLQVQKINNKKFIYTLVYKDGNKSNFQKMIKMFFENNKNVFILF